ncbi:MAG: hypothetical protein JW759_08990 [Candidatus Coatesbacteria bacterium]|nr:hypothetical protein [Candidatus Coatesbacteria bacterium]
MLFLTDFANGLKPAEKRNWGRAVEPIELEATAFLILLEDVAAQAPIRSGNGEWLNAERAAVAPEFHRQDSLTLVPNGEIRAREGTAELFQATSPKSECAPLRPYAQLKSITGHLEADSATEAAPAGVRESPLHPPVDERQFDGSCSLPEDDRRSRAGLESDVQIVNPLVRPREATSEIVFQEEERSSQEARAPSPGVMGNTRLHVPDLTSSGLAPDAGGREVTLPIGERLKLAAPVDSIQPTPTYQVSPMTSQAGSNDLLESIRRGLWDASVPTLIPSEQSTCVGVRSTRRRAAGQQSQSQLLAARIASLEEQLKPEIKKVRDHISYPRLLYPA